MKRYRSLCVLCSWASKPNTGPVFAGWDGLRHAKSQHPEAEGLVAVIEEKAKP